MQVKKDELISKIKEQDTLLGCLKRSGKKFKRLTVDLEKDKKK